jgi:hypothetical protein
MSFFAILFYLLMAAMVAGAGGVLLLCALDYWADRAAAKERDFNHQQKPL